MSIIKLFQYETRRDLLYVDNIIRSAAMSNSSPFNEEMIKLHKGVDNTVRFRVLNPDRKRVSVDHLAIRLRLINVETGERVLDRYATLLNTKGEVRATILEGDLVNVAPGYYNMVVTGQESLVPSQVSGAITNTPFYSDGYGDATFSVQILDSVDPTPQPTAAITSTDWTVNSGDRGVIIEYYSSAIEGSRIRNHINALHTVAIYTTNYSGTLSIRGSLDIQPPEDYHHYFDINITSGAKEITFSNYTGITCHSFEANFMWLLFVYAPDTTQMDYGTVDKVLVR